MTHRPVNAKDPQIAVHYKAIQSKLTKVLPQNFSLAIKWHFCFREAKVDGIPNWNREIFSQKGRILSYLSKRTMVNNIDSAAIRPNEVQLIAVITTFTSPDIFTYQLYRFSIF